MKLGTTGVLFAVMSLASGKHKMLINIYRMNGRKKKRSFKIPSRNSLGYVSEKALHLRKR